MTLLNKLAKALERSFTNNSRARAREYLLRQSDRTLLDGGFSRELLERGNRAWPWRIEGDSSTTLARFAPAARTIASHVSGSTPEPVVDQASTTVPAGKQGERQAIAELSRLGDTELADLALTRGAIADAVRHGRPGLDRQAVRQAA